MGELKRLTTPTQASLERLANLHSALLPGSQVGRLGTAFASAFYAYTAHSALETVLVYCEDEEILGAAVLSFEIDSLNRRLAGNTRLLWSIALTWLRDPYFRQLCFSKLAETLRSSSDRALPLPREWHASPELLHLFVDSSLRGKGIGSDLVAACEAECAARGFPIMRVKTLADDTNAALRFYAGRDYRRVGIVTEMGKSYAAFVKPVSMGVSLSA